MPDTENDNAAFRKMILQLSSIIKPGELEKMVFYCKDFIKASQRDKIKSFLDLIVHLEERKKVGPNSLEFLKELLKYSTNDRQDVYDPLNDYERTGVSMDATPEYPGPRQRDYSNPELDPPIDFLRRKLGRDWRFFARSLNIGDEEIDNLMDEYPRNVKEQIYRALKIYLNRKREEACKRDLIEACKQIRRMDLANKLATSNYD